ncbi:MAG: ABC transporter substrate-binding protein [Cryomorphaceae bacterium]|nr:ABC transporter substrate-binding protein [Flavobacteriales bacterium]
MKWLSVLLIPLFFSCAGPERNTDKMIFRYNESAGVSSLDPAFSRNLENLWACNMVYNSLVEIDDKLQVQPSIAKSWEIDSSGTVYRFKLREDVFFHDSEAFPNGKGRRVVASDVVYSFNRILDPKLSSPGIWVFNQLDESNPFTAIGDSIVEIRLSQSFPPFLGLLGMEYCAVVPREAVELYGADFRKNPVGTGPFKFNFWIENSRLVLLRNEAYFETDSTGRALPYLDAVSVSFIPDKGSAYLELLKGNFDFMSGLHTSYSNELLTKTGELSPIYEKQLRLEKHPFLKTDYLGFMVGELNGAKSVWSDVRLRRAVNYAIDKESMVRYLRNNVYEPANGGFIPKGMPGYDRNSGYSFNIDSARALLRAAGYPGGEGLPTLELSTTTDYVDLCEYAQHQLGEIGIKVKVNVLPASVHREMTARGDLEMFRKSWLADYPDDENFMALFYSENKSPSGPNYTHYNSALFDSLYQQALSINQPQLRTQLYAEMDSLVMADAPVVPLYYDVVMRFVDRSLTGLDNNPMNILDLRRVKIAD